MRQDGTSPLAVLAASTATTGSLGGIAKRHVDANTNTTHDAYTNNRTVKEE